MKSFIKKLIKKQGFFPIITTIFLGLFIYGAYALYYEFSATAEGIGGILYMIIGSVCTGYFFTFLSHTIFKSKKAVKNIIAFVLGNGVYNAALWISNAVVNTEGTKSEEVLTHTFTILFPVIAIVLLTALIIRSIRSKIGFRIVNIVLAVIYFIVSVGGFIIYNISRFNKLRAEKDIYFAPISAEDMKVSKAEKDKCRNWFNDKFLKADSVTDFPFDFEVDGDSIKKNPDDWSVSIGVESDTDAVRRGGKTTYITIRNTDKKLTATVEATIYEDNATCEWTIFIKNDGDSNSETISEFFALDDTFATGKAMLYYSDGSADAPSDFILNEKKVSSFKQTFNSDDGRPTDKYLPYFNISGEKNGIILGVGWTGLWEATVDKDGDGTALTVKQETFEAYLLPDEEVRSPLVSISFYNGGNAVKGFNTFRNWVKDCVYPENIPMNIRMMEVAGPESLATSDQIIYTLNTFGDDIYSEVDNFWMDAGWYKHNQSWWDSVGTWTVDTGRYDNGISELSSYAAEKGLGHVLWYEPERVCYDTELYNIGLEKDKWLVTADDDFVMWNLAEDDALEYLCQYIDKSLKENGVTVYRQDFNFAPEEYWKIADKNYYDGRKGICENHYVTNLYRFLDYLCENNEGLIIDNCASGGRRLDLEMTRRSFPAWRSDYNCAYHDDIIEATQSMTYGISFWLPVTGTINYVGTEYEARSAILPCVLDTFGTVQSVHFGAYEAQRELMTENYFPIENGGYSKDKIHAMQYSKADGSAGVAFVYKRAEVEETEFTVKLNGLNPDSDYVIYDIDHGNDATTHMGKELMEKGYTIPLPEGEKAIILMFNEVK